jgi:hypothetical protein
VAALEVAWRKDRVDLFLLQFVGIVLEDPLELDTVTREFGLDVPDPVVKRLHGQHEDGVDQLIDQGSCHGKRAARRPRTTGECIGNSRDCRTRMKVSGG